jgi:peptidoglycan/xylan/chitin deacetylase (PgdA/CDA1 family)
MLLLLAACQTRPLEQPEMPHISPAPPEVEQPQDISGDIEEYSLAEEEDEIEDAPFEIYDIKGTADSLTGSRLERHLAWRAEASSLAEQYRDILFVNKDPAGNAVYLTFDDGPDPVNTVSVINTLIEYGVSGTFFFTGENMGRHRAVVKQAYDAGFAIGLHGYSHTSMQVLTEDEVISELDETNRLLEEITGSRSTIMRPPYGAIGGEEIDFISGQGLSVYLWSLDTLDWAGNSTSDILQNIEEHLRPGEIILMHAFSGQSKSAEILPAIIEFIKEQGFEMRGLPFKD